MKDYEKAVRYLLEGLEGVKRLAINTLRLQDMYILVCYTETRETKTAKDYLTRAYDLFKSIGAERDAEKVLSAIQELEKKR